VATVTALRARGGGRVDVELDGRPWRTVPEGVAAHVGLLPGVELDRPRLRLLRAELRRSEAVSVAARTLRARELSVRGLDTRLERRGVAPNSRAEAIDALVRAGIVDDERFAANRARSLAERRRGDAAIRWTLEREGVAADAIERALGTLEPERQRARRIASERGPTRATAGFLAARGFSEDAVEEALAGDGRADDAATLG